MTVPGQCLDDGLEGPKFDLQVVHNGSGAHGASVVMVTVVFFPSQCSCLDANLTTLLHLVLRLRIDGATLLLPLDVFMAERDTFAFTFTFARIMHITKHAASVADDKFFVFVAF
jgi:hypothetical protein